MRSHLRAAMREFFTSHNYVEGESPVIVPTPGTETYLDYFSTEWLDFADNRHRRYLRSSPELHLKQLLAAGIDRVYELGPCFRNGGEKSQWHHPEFTMLEYYAAAMSFSDFIDHTEKLVRACRAALAQSGHQVMELPSKFQRITVKEAFKAATKIELQDNDPELTKKAMAQGYRSVQPTDDFETTFFKLMLDFVEPALRQHSCVFLYDYLPSQAALAKIENGVAKRFELYINGEEICNAFAELTDAPSNIERYRETQKKRQLIGKELIDLDPGFSAALEAGLPASCGSALGFDRLLAVLLGLPGISDVIPFRQNDIYPT